MLILSFEYYKSFLEGASGPGLPQFAKADTYHYENKIAKIEYCALYYLHFKKLSKCLYLCAPLYNNTHIANFIYFPNYSKNHKLYITTYLLRPSVAYTNHMLHINRCILLSVLRLSYNDRGDPCL